MQSAKPLASGGDNWWIASIYTGMDITDPIVIGLAGVVIVGGGIAITSCFGKKSSSESTPGLKVANKKAKKNKAKKEAEKPIASALNLVPAPGQQPILSLPRSVPMAAAPGPTPSPSPASTPAAAKYEAPEQQQQPTGKKPKETAEQKATRLEKERIKKEAKREQEEADVRLVEQLLRREEREAGYGAAGGGPSSTADGWAVVDSGKAKKQPDAAPSSSSSSSSSSSCSSSSAAPTTTPAPVVGHQSTVAPAAAPAAAHHKAPTPAPAAPAAAPKDPTPEPAGPEVVTSTIEVDAKKIGLLIGPKGATKMAIQEKTGVEIMLPQKSDKEITGPVDIIVSGPADGVFFASRAIRDLAAKGYCALLGGDTFSEGHIVVHHMYVADILGPKGANIKAIQENTGCHVRVPRERAIGDTQPVKVDVAGPREKVVAAKALIKELCKFRHHPVTHPNCMHIEMDVPAMYNSYIIGAKGSEIRHIQANFKVSVYIPNEDTYTKTVLVVGERAGCEAAERYIKKIIEQAIQKQKDREREFNDDDVEEHDEAPSASEDWTDQYDATKRSGPTIASVFTATQKSKQTKAWGVPAAAPAAVHSAVGSEGGN